MPYIQRGGIDIHFEDKGSGTPVILGHSFLCSGEMWRHQVPVLSGNARVVNMDYRGHGRSGRAQSPFTIYDLVDDALSVLDFLEIDKAVWGGLSIGGMVSMRAALRYPERVSGLMLFNTHAGSEMPAKKLNYKVLGIISRLFGIGIAAPLIARMMFGRTARRNNPLLVKEWKKIFSESHTQSILFGLQALLERDSVVDRLPDIKVPCLVVTGREDAALSPASSKEIAEAIPDAELVEVSNAGHLSALEQPEAVNSTIADFLEKHKFVS